MWLFAAVALVLLVLIPGFRQFVLVCVAILAAFVVFQILMH